jgi:hypothetical protein
VALLQLAPHQQMLCRAVVYQPDQQSFRQLVVMAHG